MKATPPIPEPTSADLASRAAYGAYRQRYWGYQIPPSDLEQYRRFGDPPPAVSAQILAGVLPPRYEQIRVPALAIFALPVSASTFARGYDYLSPQDRSRVDQVWPQWAALVRSHRDRFDAQVRGATSVVLEGATHYLFISDADAVTRPVRQFLRQFVGP
jgi:hypothetical protein